MVNNGAGKIQCRLDAFKTGIALRDKHMLGYLDAENHPMVTLIFQGKGDKFTGTLELKGKKRPVEGAYSNSPLNFDFIVDINEFGIDTPKYLGVGIERHIRITAGLH